MLKAYKTNTFCDLPAAEIIFCHSRKKDFVAIFSLEQLTKRNAISVCGFKIVECLF